MLMWQTLFRAPVVCPQGMHSSTPQLQKKEKSYLSCEVHFLWNTCESLPLILISTGL